MNKSLYILASLLTALLCFGCTPESLEKEPTMLELDKPEVRLTKDKGEMVVSVKTNEESVVAISNRDWITAVPEGKSVKLVYDENKVIGQRDAVVLVQAGDLVKALKVTQEGNALDVTTVPEAIVLEPWDSEVTISVRVNGEGWTCTSATDWIQVTSLPWKKEVILRADANKSGGARQSEIIFQVEGEAGTVAVTVKQKEWPLFLLPYIDFEYGTMSLISRFEMERRSMIKQTLTGSVTFTTTSPMMSQIAYSFSTKGVMTAAQAYIAPDYTTTDEDGETMITKEAMHVIDSALLAEGFTEKQGKLRYFDPSTRVVASIKDHTYDPNIEYIYIPKQPQAYKTFDKIPYIPVAFGADYSEVQKYEQENGGVYFPDGDQYDDANGLCYFEYKVPGSKQIKSRNYFLSWDASKGKVGALLATFQEWSDINLVYWEYNGRLNITEEFLALCEKDGFKYNGKTSDGKMDVFINDTKGIQMKTQFAHFEGEEDPSLVIMMLPYVSSKTQMSALDHKMTQMMKLWK